MSGDFGGRFFAEVAVVRMPRMPMAAATHKRRQRGPDNRPSAAARMYGRRWRRQRKFYLAKHPLCAECLARGLTTAATRVDHVEPHRGDRKKFKDRENWQSLCESCHNRKSVKERKVG